MASKRALAELKKAQEAWMTLEENYKNNKADTVLNEECYQAWCKYRDAHNRWVASRKHSR